MSKSLKNLAKKHPDKITFSDEDESKQPSHSLEDQPSPPKIVVEPQDLATLIEFGSIQIFDKDIAVELVLKRGAEHEVIIKTAKADGGSSKIIVPKSWLGSRVIALKSSL